jgi:hypothetical protein
LASHSVTNPDMQSERRLLAQLAPEMDEDMIRRLVAAFQDLRRGYDEGKLSYPYSLRGDACPVVFTLKGKPKPVTASTPSRAHQSCTPYESLPGLS